MMFSADMGAPEPVYSSGVKCTLLSYYSKNHRECSLPKMKTLFVPLLLYLRALVTILLFMQENKQTLGVSPTGFVAIGERMLSSRPKSNLHEKSEN